MDGDERPRITRRRAFVAACGLAATAGCTAPAIQPSGDARRPTTESTATRETDARFIDVPAGAEWPTFGGDAGNTGRREAGSGPVEPPTAAWRYDVNGIFTMPGPALVDGTVYVGSGETAYATDATTGTLRWSTNLGAYTHYFSPSVTAEGVLFGAQSNINGGELGTLTSFATDGTERWARDLAVTASPKSAGGTVYVGTSPEEGAVVRSLSDVDGSDGWTRPLDATAIRGAVALVDDVVYAAATDVPAESGVVVALDAADGSEVWTRRFDAGLRAAPAVRDDTLYAQADDGRLFALDAGSGETTWATRLGSNAATSPALGENYLVGMVENQLVGLERTTGEVAWRTDVGFTLINGVSIAAGRAYVGGSRLTAVDVGTGDVAWEQQVPGTGGGFGAPIVLGNALFVGVCIKEEANDPYDDFLYAYI